jgi:hypothetical protein
VTHLPIDNLELPFGGADSLSFGVSPIPIEESMQFLMTDKRLKDIPEIVTVEVHEMSSSHSGRRFADPKL